MSRIGEWWKRFSIDHLGAVDHDAIGAELSALIEKNKCFYAAINWFSDGGACPRCGSGESEVHPKPWQCDKCGAMHHTFHVRRTCNACNYSVTRVREDRDE